MWFVSSGVCDLLRSATSIMASWFVGGSGSGEESIVAVAGPRRETIHIETSVVLCCESAGGGACWIDNFSNHMKSWRPEYK